MSHSAFTAIHQPNFFPWLGYFNKIARADVFIVLDNVQHTKTGSNWSNRVKLFISAEPRWVTAPISRPAHGTIALNQVEWANLPWREKLLKTLATNYQVAPFYDEAIQHTTALSDTKVVISPGKPAKDSGDRAARPE